MPIENLTLTANGVFKGQHNVNEVLTKTTSNTKTYEYIKNNGHVELALGAKYDYKVNDKLTITPEAEIRYTAANIHQFKMKASETNVTLKALNGKVVAQSSLKIAPKVSAEYEILKDTLTLGASLGAEINFANKLVLSKVDNSEDTTVVPGLSKFDYTDSNVKASMNLKYSW